MFAAVGVLLSITRPVHLIGIRGNLYLKNSFPYIVQKCCGSYNDSIVYVAVIECPSPQQLNHPNVIMYLASFVENNEVRLYMPLYWLSGEGHVLCCTHTHTSTHTHVHTPPNTHTHTHTHS